MLTVRSLQKAGLKIDKFDYENMLILLLDQIGGLEILKEVDE